ncbi:MAG: hypothetical protein M1299_09800 [Firmicutes bacterium]|nr:hypothetical protein [Bacillota bacterium]MCL5040098.1 hypothetical protein [Bacillota bacterium]
MRKELPILVSFLFGAVVILAKYISLGPLPELIKVLDKWSIVSGAFAFLFGMINLSLLHGHNVARRKSDYLFSLYFIIVMWAFFFLGLYQTQKGYSYKWIFDNVYTPGTSTMYGMIAFYIATSAYRAFRARTMEATVLLVGAAIVMLGNAPVGAVIWKQFPVISDWLLKIPNTAGMRGILVGVYLGALTTAIRIILGLERGHLGGRG